MLTVGPTQGVLLCARLRYSILPCLVAMFPFVFFLSLLSNILPALSDVPPFLNSEDYQFSKYGPYPRQRFFSDLEVIAPVPNIIVPPQKGISPEKLISWAPHGDQVPIHGPQLLDAETLSVVYQAPAFDEDNFGISVQSCNGSDYLVWWSGTNIDGRAAGHFYMLNSTYHSVFNISSVGLKLADAHDIFITPDCHAVITVYEPKPFELEDFGLQDNSWLLDSYIQEIDLATNELVFQWRASDHIDLHESLWLPQIAGENAEWQGLRKQNAWDFFHVNSVEKDWKGNFLISARHTNAIYYIDGVDGNVLWTLGGKRNQFEDLNDGYIKSSDPISRGALITLDFDAMTASLKHNYRAPSHIESFRKGSMQVLPSSNVLLGFGNQPAFTEYAPNGTVLWDAHMGPVMAGYDRETADNYRSLKVNWTGTPYWSPKIAAGPTLVNATDLLDAADGSVKDWVEARNDTVYMSWNGAMELKRWMIFAAAHPLELDSLGSLFATVNKTGFETGVLVGRGENSTRFLRAVALDKDEKMMKATPILDMETGRTYEHAKDILMGDGGSWWSGEQAEQWDATILEAMAEVDSLERLRQEWDMHRSRSEKSEVLLPAVLGLAAVFCLLAWYGRKQLIETFEDKYGVFNSQRQGEEEGDDEERTRLRDTDEEKGLDDLTRREGIRNKLQLVYSWRQ
ncbi:hypothetical protein D6D28_06557 [Aureobasidium pullulans]|uniref:ASST-domain-containing protein n=1 Tax=Aureobasidium pullulans TaxID=5580 RepID=A0A4S8SDK6_AURPU|nr:hypothetical protein D6D28_06557 [Aureobasidium pullulans]